MMGLHQRSVNVARFVLLDKLTANRAIHAAEYAEALVDFKERLVADLVSGAEQVMDTPVENLSKFTIDVDYPQSHLREYDEVIEMLELSVDENINLDAQAFRAYVKNEWSWTENFKNTMSNYKVGSFLSINK